MAALKLSLLLLAPALAVRSENEQELLDAPSGNLDVLVQPSHPGLANLAYFARKPECQRELWGLMEALVHEHPNEKEVFAIFHLRDRRKSPTSPAWLEALARPEHKKEDSMLWAGFWDGQGSEENRTTKEALRSFAKQLHMQIVHPNTRLGRIVADQNDLQNCSGEHIRPVDRFWHSASIAFVQNMYRRKQRSLVVLINKSLKKTDPRNLHETVLYQYEIPAIRENAVISVKHGNAWWPHILLVDLHGDCRDLKKTFTLKLQEEENALMRRLVRKKPVDCIECGESCKLDQQLAKKVQKRLGS
ncbi:unnamed protein product [Symbiodinium pilosum]|uniref:Uncharacterized protein n=1 Tax=Symbiodinium pilosum TaxID=2952 RepID=A0A812UCG2_SYMPI|nr:unnamed protein product [Symbiodinium pilosum]